MSSVNLLRQTVQVRLDSAPETPKCYHNSELCVIRSGKGKRWLLRHLRQAGYPDAEKLFCVEWTPGRGFYIVPLEEPDGRDAAKETLSAD